MKNLFLIAALLTFSTTDISAQSPGNSLQFDGTGDYVTMNLPTVFSDIANNDFSVETWVKPNGSTTQRIFFAQFSAASFASILLNGSNQPYVYVSDGTTNYGLNLATGLTSGVWSHLAFTWEASTQQILIYVNGVLQTTGAGGSSSTGSSGIMTIGSKTDGTQNLNAELDEFRVWDIVLSQCQLQAGMNSEYTLSQTGLVAYYNFNQGVAAGSNAGVTSLPDFTTNYNGTLTNFALSGTSSNWLASLADITTVNQSSAILGSTETIVTCDFDYFWSANSTTYTTSGTYMTTLATVVNGCDSIVTLDLTFNTVNSGAAQSGFTLTADAVGASYQWLDCNNAYAEISAQTSQIFTPVSDGNYAVEVTENGCTDTSSCFTIAGIGWNENSQSGFSVYPNPTSGNVTVMIGKSESETILRIRNMEGKLVQEILLIDQNLVSLDLPEVSGIYFVEIISDTYSQVFKVTKN